MKADPNLLSGSTPMLVLSLLKSGDKYGYEMISELARRSDDTFLLKEGTLYPLLHSLGKKRACEFIHQSDGKRTVPEILSSDTEGCRGTC